VELKNINSFKFVKEALEYEIKRQATVLDAGGTIQQETRLWDVDKGQTAVMRSKEEAHDYRYFPDPDLVPVKISDEWVAEVRATLPELPATRRQRFVSEYGLSEYDTGVLTDSRELGDYFEACVKLFGQPKPVSNWVMGELLRELNHTGTQVSASPVTPDRLVSLMRLVEDGTNSLKAARDLFPEFYATGKSAEALIREKGLMQVSDETALGAMIDEVMVKNPAQLAQYRAGKEQVLGFFVGQVIKASGGKANPGKVNELLKKKLAG
jgi:aspartyl-tRNA(Asn)/glutamyl-tRNA(Gln) amidotransferase subunit B